MSHFVDCLDLPQSAGYLLDVLYTSFGQHAAAPVQNVAPQVGVIFISPVMLVHDSLSGKQVIYVRSQLLGVLAAAGFQYVVVKESLDQRCNRIAKQIIIFRPQ